MGAACREGSTGCWRVTKVGCGARVTNIINVSVNRLREGMEADSEPEVAEVGNREGSALALDGCGEYSGATW